MAKKRSFLLRDQQIPPMDTAVFWVEHVIRHKNGDHLKNYGENLPWYQYHMLDAIAFVILLAIIMYSLVYISVKILRGMSFKDNKQTDKSKTS